MKPLGAVTEQMNLKLKPKVKSNLMPFEQLIRLCSLGKPVRLTLVLPLSNEGFLVEELN